MSVVQRTAFLTALKKLIVATTKQANTLGLHCIGFTGSHLIAFEDYIGIMVKFHTDFKGTLVAHDLYQMIQSFSTEEITMTEDDTHVILRSGKSRRKLPKQDVPLISRFYSVLPTLDNLKEIPDNFTKMLTDSILPPHEKVMGVFVDGCDIIATDNAMMYQSIFEGQLDPMRLAYKYVGILNNYSPTHVQIGTTWVTFTDDECTIIVRSMPVTGYPHAVIKSAISAYKEAEAIVDGAIPKELVEIVTDVDKLQAGDPVDCEVEFTSTGITVSFANQKGSYTEEAEWEGEVQEESFTISLPPKQLRLLLKGEVGTLKLCRGFKDKLGLVVNGSNFTRIVGIVE